MESGQLQSKQPRSAVAGSYGHPVHPILVTVPIGAWVCSLVFDFVSYGSGNPRTWSGGAMWLVLFGAIGAAVAGGLAQWGPPATKDFLGMTPAEALRDFSSFARGLRRGDTEFDLARLRGLLKVATS